ncbi:hypothetical protein D3C85_1508940 [compost metagenome]
MPTIRDVKDQVSNFGQADAQLSEQRGLLLAFAIDDLLAHWLHRERLDGQDLQFLSPLAVRSRRDRRRMPSMHPPKVISRKANQR